MAASHHGDTPYSGNSVTSVPVTPYTTSVDVNVAERQSATQLAQNATGGGRDSKGYGRRNRHLDPSTWRAVARSSIPLLA